jgi:hypothetical protein
MARPSALAGMTIAQLEGLIATRQNRLEKVARERDQVQRQLDRLDEEIRRLSGRAGASSNGNGPHRRNGMSLVATLEAVLAGGKPKSVGEIVEAVQNRGYRSGSANFRGIVNQTLVKEKQFVSAGRGVYQLQK